MYHKNLDQMVFSDGNHLSKIMLIGDTPGVTDEINRKPFSGDSGKLLDKMLIAINLNRTLVYITNIINFRLPDNKKPSEYDIKKFKPLIFKHIDIIKPNIILILGSVALETLFEKTYSISKARGEWLELNVNNNIINCMPSFHPSFLIRQPDQKKRSWDDLKKFKNKVIEENLC